MVVVQSALYVVCPVGSALCEEKRIALVCATIIIANHRLRRPSPSPSIRVQYTRFSVYGGKKEDVREIDRERVDFQSQA